MSENPTGNDTAGEGYQPEQDPDSDPEMLDSAGPAGSTGENRRDPAEGADDESATDG